METLGAETGTVTTRIDSCSLAVARRVAAMLDIDPDLLADRQPLPRGWQFPLLAGDTPRSLMRGDGFPGFGVPMPDLGLPRLMLAGRSVTWAGDIHIGDAVERRSKVTEITEKTGPTGRMALVSLRHELRALPHDAPGLIETQTYALLPAAQNGVKSSRTKTARDARPLEARCHLVTPDQTLLFQYSALGFNSHKIHLDRDHAQKVEGLPDLVVNGGLTMLQVTEYLRHGLGVSPKHLKARYTAPLYCNRPMTLQAQPADSGWTIRVLDDANILAAEFEVQS
ncbi:FAS1-like dehydratase domain-containing protein [Cypionkella sp.]|uniref:FAS1-like dehydratase domain-containing protein n=1 Tax=Cypionkella sp. TaxID=2811411 RepID=UPI002FDEA305